MAFTYEDGANSKKATFDFACSEAYSRDISGQPLKFMENGLPVIPPWMFPFTYNQRVAVDAITPAAAATPTDTATLIVSVNELKTKFNALLAALKTA